MPIDPRMKDPHEKSSIIQTLSRHRGWGRPDFLHMRGSVIITIIPVVFFSTIIASIVTVLYVVLNKNVTLPDSIIFAISVVVGLLLAFRTNNAYDRYYEGRKLFGSLCTQIRNISRLTWVDIKEETPQDHKEKETIIKLLLAFVVAVKHHLRLEFGTQWFDLEDLLPEGFQLALFEGNAGQENTDLGSGSNEDHRDDPNHPDNRELPASETPTIVVHNAHNNDHHHQQSLPHTKAAIRSLAGSWSQTTIYFNNSKLGDSSEIDASMSLPLEIVFHLGAYYDKQIMEKKIPGAAYGAISGSLNTLIDILGSLERIGNTPIPFAYRIHLKQAVTIYVWILPFTLVRVLGWITIPIVAIISFILFGVEAIGSEIENPFGYDRNDLPLDEYCKDLEAELKYLQKYLPSNQQ